jgi:8-amino-3,8-dideoxy-alpha-D-manno-octulosonate transaminase
MPGYELIDFKEKLALIKLFKRPINIIGKDKIVSFEEKIKQIVNSKYCQVVTSGTAATKIALKAVGVKRGDEVITQAFNFIATVEAIHELGAKPILTNIDDSLNMDIDDLENKITKKTKAIVPVHMLGVPCNMEKILKISKKYRIPIIEDNCESFGAKYKKRYLGTLGDAGILSFDGGKTITTGEGGAILTNNKKIYIFTNQYRDHGHENNPKFPRGMDTSSITGFNYRFTQLQAVFGIEQLKKMQEIKKDNKKKYMILSKEISRKYQERKIPKYSDPLYDCYIFKVRNKKKRTQLVKELKKNGLGTKNLPDAIKWHCAYHWNLMIDMKQIKHLKYSRDLLNQHIAIPIFYSKSEDYYKKIALYLSSL